MCKSCYKSELYSSICGSKITPSRYLLLKSMLLLNVIIYLYVWLNHNLLFNFTECYRSWVIFSTNRLNLSALNKISILILKERSCISVIDYREPSNQSKEEFNQQHSNASMSPFISITFLSYFGNKNKKKI